MTRWAYNEDTHDTYSLDGEWCISYDVVHGYYFLYRNGKCSGGLYTTEAEAKKEVIRIKYKENYV